MRKFKLVETNCGKVFPFIYTNYHMLRWSSAAVNLQSLPGDNKQTNRNKQGNKQQKRHFNMITSSSDDVNKSCSSNKWS